MKGVIRGHGATSTYFLDGRPVSREEFFEYFPPAVSLDGTGLIAFKPLHSEALAVHPDQIAEATEDAKRKGVPVEFDPEGRPIFTSSRQFRAYARLYGWRHKGY